MIDTSVLNIDFEVIGCSTNCKSLKIVDLSNWGPAINNPVFINVTPPGANNAVSNVFYKKQVNVLNSNNLQYSDVTDYSFLPNLPDGVYQICLEVCMGSNPGPSGTTIPVFNTTCKYFLQDCQLRCAISRKLMSIDLTCQPCRVKLLEEIEDIQLFLDAAHAQIDNCNVNKAMEYFRHAQTELSRLQAPGGNSGCGGCGGGSGEW